MFRVRFHGRGGQGMKTASRILGSAAFHAGYIVQDSPIYGAERRGAPMAAFVRIASNSIHERGLLSQPDLAVLADDTLLNDPAAQPLAGADTTTVLLLNTTKDETTVRQLLPIPVSRLYVVDLTALAQEHTHTVSGLSTALGVASARLLGLTPTDIEAGLRDELADHMTTEQWNRNLALTRVIYTVTTAWRSITERSDTTVVVPSPIVDVPFDPPRIATPSVAALANSPERRTGNWRQFRPVLQQELCTRCWICFVRCPEAAISLARQDYPVVDYDVCKGCLLCVHECPTHAFTAEKEVR